MSLENEKSADEVTQITLPQPKSQSPNKLKRTQKVNWTASDEKETYSTVVLNYHYSKVDKNLHQNQPQSQSQQSTGAIPKKRNTSTWSKMLSAMAPSSKESVKAENNNSNSNLNDDDDVPNLSKLYNSKEELTTESKDEVRPTNTEDIKVEIYCVPKKQQAIIEEPLIKKMEELRALKETIADIETETETEDAIHFSADIVQEARAPEPFMLDPEIIIISDDNEDGDDEAEEGTEKTKVDEAQQTNQINNKTKATQNPEPSKISKKIRTRGQHASPATTSSTTDSSNNAPKYKEIPGVENSAYNLKVKVPSQSNYKQRQLELHRYRIAVEQKRLELLELKLARERDEMLREQMLFDKELELKSTQLKQVISDRDNEDKL